MEITRKSYAKTNNPKNLPVYNSIAKIKAHGVKEPYLRWELEELNKCIACPNYFIENYIILDGEYGAERFELYKYQKDAITDIKREKYSIILAPRRAGKSICILGYIMWFSVFTPNKKVYVLSKTLDDSKKLLEKLQLMYESLPFFLQVGVTTYAKESVVLSNNTRIYAASSKGVRGDDADILYCVAADSVITVKDDEGNISDLRFDDAEKLYSTRKHHVVYRTTNLINNKVYVGYHGTNDLDDNYLGSGTNFKKSVTKYGRENFKREILFVYDNATDAYNKEREIVNHEFVVREDTYNLTLGGTGTTYWGVACEEYRNEPIVNTVTGRIYETFKDVPEDYTAYKTVVECGNPNSSYEFEDGDLQEDAIKVYNNRMECNKKISESNMGKKCLNPHNKCPKKIEKMAEKHRGMKRSEESKRKMSLAAKGKIPDNRALTIDDVRKIRLDYENKVEVNLISEHGNTLLYKSAFCKAYAKTYNVSVPNIRNVIDRKTYGEIV